MRNLLGRIGAFGTLTITMAAWGQAPNPATGAGRPGTAASSAAKPGGASVAAPPVASPPTAAAKPGGASVAAPPVAQPPAATAKPGGASAAAPPVAASPTAAAKPAVDSSATLRTTSATAPSVAAPAAPAGVSFQLEGSAVVALQGDSKAKIPIPETVTAILASGNQLYVAHGDAGIAVYDVAKPLLPRLLREQSTNGGYANGFALIDGQVWVLVTSKMAMPVGVAEVGAEPPVTSTLPVESITPPGTPRNTPVAASHQPTNAERGAELENFEVRLVSPGVVQIATSSDAPTKLGDRFAIFRTEVRAGAEREAFTGETLVGTAEVVAVREGSCLAELSRMTTARPNDYARRTMRSEEQSNFYPTRVPHMGEYSAVLRPVLNIGSPVGVGVLADLELTYWGGSYFAGATVQPLGIGTSASGSVVTIAALAEGGYDGKAFSAGLGVGAGWVNGDIDDMLGTQTFSDSAGMSTETTKQSTHGAFAVSQVVRLGARDGLRLHLRNVLLLHRESDTSERGFIYGGTAAKMTVPTGRTADLFVEGGGGIMGYWFFGIGVGTWLIGNGSPGSLHLSVSAGGAGIYSSREVTRTYSYNGQTSSTYVEQDDFGVAGPMVSIGLTRRFEL